MWLWGANPWAHSSDLPTPGDSMPTVLARRHWSGHQALGASYQTTADGGLPSSHRPEDLAQSSHRTQKKKKNFDQRWWICCQAWELSSVGRIFYWRGRGEEGGGGGRSSFQKIKIKSTSNQVCNITNMNVFSYILSGFKWHSSDLLEPKRGHFYYFRVAKWQIQHRLGWHIFAEEGRLEGGWGCDCRSFEMLWHYPQQFPYRITVNVPKLIFFISPLVIKDVLLNKQKWMHQICAENTKVCVIEFALEWTQVL